MKHQMNHQMNTRLKRIVGKHDLTKQGGVTPHPVSHLDDIIALLNIKVQEVELDVLTLVAMESPHTCHSRAAWVIT